MIALNIQKLVAKMCLRMCPSQLQLLHIAVHLEENAVEVLKKNIDFVISKGDELRPSCRPILRSNTLVWWHRLVKHVVDSINHCVDNCLEIIASIGFEITQLHTMEHVISIQRVHECRETGSRCCLKCNKLQICSIK